MADRDIEAQMDVEEHWGHTVKDREGHNPHDPECVHASDRDVNYWSRDETCGPCGGLG